jgi:1-deoxyxylulose-5-phosphate synthase
MEYQRLGNTGIKVSRLCLGCMDFPTRLDEDGSRRLLEEAMAAGINFLDTADAYERGEGERSLGKLIKGHRDDLVIATKFWVKMYDRVNGRGCSRTHIIHAVEDSLKRLDTDFIDLIALHHPDVDTPIEETISTLDNLIKQGKIRYYGVSNYFAWQVAHMLGVSALHNWEPPVSIQCRYNIMDRPVENETVPFATKFDIAMLAYGPLDWGVLTGKYERGGPIPEGDRLARFNKYYRETMLTDETFDILDVLQGIADKNGVTMPQLAVGWLLSKPYVTSVILGGSKPEHFSQVYDACELTVDPEDIAEIDRLTMSRRFKQFANQIIPAGTPLALNRM